MTAGNPWTAGCRCVDEKDSPTGLDLVDPGPRRLRRTTRCGECGAAPGAVHSTGCGDPWFAALYGPVRQQSPVGGA
jgi:hypothetical protein